MSLSWRVFSVVLGAFAGLCCCVSGASAAVNPGWECIPTAAGMPVLSGGTGSAPACASGNTAVLAPTYVSSGAGGQPTAQFSAVNVQVVSGSGATAGAVNGRGNLIIGYDEMRGTQTGSHDLVLGTNQSYTGFASIVGGTHNTASESYGAVLGSDNTAGGRYGVVLGSDNTASGKYATVTGGSSNVASGNLASVTGGEGNLAKQTSSSIGGGCDNVAGTGLSVISCPGSGFESISGGFQNQASGLFGTVSGGAHNTASGSGASVAGGGFNTASGASSWLGGGDFNTAGGLNSVVAGGEFNVAKDHISFIGAGCDNLTGPGTNRTDTCNAGGESILGGAGQHLTAQDSTYPAGP